MMRRETETALLHGHPLIREEDDQMIDLRRDHPEWMIGRCPTGFEAFHRHEAFNERSARVGVLAEIRRTTVGQLAEALTVQRALRGDGAEPIR